MSRPRNWGKEVFIIFKIYIGNIPAHRHKCQGFSREESVPDGPLVPRPKVEGGPDSRERFFFGLVCHRPPKRGATWAR